MVDDTRAGDAGAIVARVTGDPRLSILSIVVLFIGGGVLLVVAARAERRAAAAAA